MEADGTRDREANESTGWSARLGAVLAAGCCVLPIAIIFLSGIVAGWVRTLEISDKAWSEIALGVLATAVAAMVLRGLWKRRAERRGSRRPPS